MHDVSSENIVLEFLLQRNFALVWQHFENYVVFALDNPGKFLFVFLSELTGK